MFAPDRRSGVVAFVGLVVLFLAAERTVAGVFGLPLDDAWIHATFARNLARGDGLSYGEPGHWVAGSTAPLWTWLLAGVFKVTGDPVLAARILGISAGVLALLATARLAQAATGDAAIARWSALLLALTARHVWGALSGMEIPLYVALVALGLALHLERRSRPLATWIVAPAVLALAGWARPECFVFVLVAAAHRRRRVDFALAALLLAPYPVYHLLIHGHPLPTTFYVKAAGRSALALVRTDPGGAVVTGGWSVAQQLAAFAAYLPTHLPLVAVGLLPGIVRGVRERNGVPFLAVALLCFIAAKGLVTYDAPWMQYGRYFAHAWPMFLILCLHGIDLTRKSGALSAVVLLVVVACWIALPKVTPAFLFDRYVPGAGVTEADARRIVVPGLALVALVVAGLGASLGSRPRGRVARPPAWALALYLAPALLYGAEHHAWNVLDTEELNVRMAEEVRRVVPPDATVACHDIGALGYFGERKLLDLAGIASPRVAFHPGGPDAAAAIAAERPRYLCVLDGWLGKLFPGGAPPPGLTDHTEVLRISRPQNITLGGSEYYLLQLGWR